MDLLGGMMKKRTAPILFITALLSGAAALGFVAPPAQGLKPAKHYTSPETTCVWGDRTDYAPHSYAVCSDSSVRRTRAF